MSEKNLNFSKRKFEIISYAYFTKEPKLSILACLNCSVADPHHFRTDTSTAWNVDEDPALQVTKLTLPDWKHILNYFLLFYKFKM